METGGIFVARARHLSLAGSNSVGGAPFVPMSPRVAASPKRNEGGKSPWQGGAGGQKSQRDTKTIGATIRIIKGPYKGHIGIVKDATPNDCRVELHSNVFVHITVKREHLTVVDSHGRSDRSYGGGSARTPHYGSNTPAYHGGARTPAYGSTTPRADGSRTPSYGDGGRTPQYDGSRTPNREENPWNSKVANTPRDDFGEFDNPTTPGTPNFRDEFSAPSPSYAPQTPQYEQNNSTPFSMNPTPSPGGSFSGNSITPSPGYGSTGPTPSPGGYNPTPSPGGYTAKVHKISFNER